MAHRSDRMANPAKTVTIKGLRWKNGPYCGSREAKGKRKEAEKQMILTKRQQNELWGESGPYSQAQLITEVRILDDAVSRTFLIVSVNINPFTFRHIKKHIGSFKDDRIITGIIEHGTIEGPNHGYSLYLFQEEYVDKSVMQRAEVALAAANAAIIVMHRFVMESLGLSNAPGEPRNKSFVTQKLLTEVAIERYLKAAHKSHLSDIDEANAVLRCSMEWWNEKLTTEERKKLETLSAKEQRKAFMGADIDFSPALTRTGEKPSKADADSLCPCGSGKKYNECCWQDTH